MPFSKLSGNSLSWKNPYRQISHVWQCEYNFACPINSGLQAYLLPFYS